jgi:hypothetical protein
MVAQIKNIYSGAITEAEPNFLESTDYGKKLAQSGWEYLPASQQSMGDVLKNLDLPEDTALKEFSKQEADLALQASKQPVDEATIREETMKRWQAEIDALNQIYAQQKREATQRGLGRLGVEAAIQARRGLFGSDFGAAQTAGVEAVNLEEQKAIDAEKAIKIASVMNKVNTDVLAEVEKKKAAKQAGADAYLTYLQGEAKAKRNLLSRSVKSFLNSGLEGTDQELKNLADKLGVSLDIIKEEYNLQKITGDTTKPVEVSQGAALVNPLTGKVIYSPQYKPEILSPLEERKKLLEIQKLQDDITLSTGGLDKQIKQAELQKKLQELSNLTVGQTPYQEERAYRTIQSVNELLDQVNNKTTGWGAFLLGKLPESEARNFASQLETLKANIAFNELTAMREASKTGGALGNVSDKESSLLTNALGALDQMQSPEQFKIQLNKIKDSVKRWQDAVNKYSNKEDFSW